MLLAVFDTVVGTVSCVSNGVAPVCTGSRIGSCSVGSQLTCLFGLGNQW